MSKRNKWILGIVVFLSALFGVGLVTGVYHMPKNADFSYTHPTPAKPAPASNDGSGDPSFGVLN